MSAALALFAGIALGPLAVVVGARARTETERLRSIAVAAAALTFAIALVGAAFADAVAVPWPRPLPAIFGEHALRLDALSVALFPLPAALWLLTVAVTPRSMLSRAGLPRTALATLATTLAFATDSPLLLAALWVATTWAFLAALAMPEARASRRVGALYLWSSALLFAVGIVLITGAAPAGGWLERAGLWAIVVAVLIRKAIVPFHAWLPDLFDRGQLGPAVLFSAPQLGSYVAAVLVVPRASPELLRVVAVLSLLTAVYGAALAVFQRDARRACGYLFVSQSALVLAGLDCTSTEALAGALVVWISSALAFAGVARCVLVVEARRGRLDLRRHHGGYEQMPLVAVSFLVLGLACTGFPGTLGFVGEELLVAGAIGAFPLLGFAVVVASALTGIAVLRMYFSMFCGVRYRGAPMPIRRREAVVFGTLACAVVLGGLAPRPIVAVQLDAAEAVLRRAGDLRAPQGAAVVSAPHGTEPQRAHSADSLAAEP